MPRKGWYIIIKTNNAIVIYIFTFIYILIFSLNINNTLLVFLINPHKIKYFFQIHKCKSLNRKHLSAYFVIKYKNSISEAARIIIEIHFS